MKTAILLAVLVGWGLNGGSGVARAAETPLMATALADPSAEDSDAYYAIAQSFNAADTAISKAVTDEIFKGAGDPVKLCQLAKQRSENGRARLARELEFLRALQKAGKSAEGLISSYLSSSGLTDTLTTSQADYCAKAKAGGDDIKETILYVQDLMAQLEAIKAAYGGAVASGDKLIELASLQSQSAYYGEIIAYIEILEVVEKPGPTIRGLIAQLPVLKYRAEETAQLNRDKVYPYTDPDGSRYGAYVFKPIELPPMPQDDEAFQEAITGPLLGAIRPSLQAGLALMKGDKATACVNAKYGPQEVSRLKAFIEAYLAQQTKAGKPTALAEDILKKVLEMQTQAQGIEQTACKPA